MKPERVEGMERKLMSDFVRKRIEALTTNTMNDDCGDVMDAKFMKSEKGSNSTMSTTTDSFRSSSTLDNNDNIDRNIDRNIDDVATNTNSSEPRHKGCPICTACFAGFKPPVSSEQVRLSVDQRNINDAALLL